MVSRRPFGSGRLRNLVSHSRSAVACDGEYPSMLVEDAAGEAEALPDCSNAKMSAATEKRRVTGSASWSKCILGCRKSSARWPDYIARRRRSCLPHWWQKQLCPADSTANLHTIFLSTAAAKAVSAYFSKLSTFAFSTA